MNDEQDLDTGDRVVRDMLRAASAEVMPDQVFARISQALSMEVQLRHEDPDREVGPRSGRAASHGPSTRDDSSDLDPASCDNMG